MGWRCWHHHARVRPDCLLLAGLRCSSRSCKACAATDKASFLRRASIHAQNGFVTLASTQEELRKVQAAESRKWRKIITAAGIVKESVSTPA